MTWRKWVLAALAVCVFASVLPSVAGSSVSAGEPAPEWPVMVQDADGGETLYSSLQDYLLTALPLPAEEAGNEYPPKIYELKPDPIPDGYSRLFLAVVDRIETTYIVLLAADAYAGHIALLDKIFVSPDGELVINMAKLDVSVDGSRITVWSQAPFRAFQSEAVVEWDGKKLNLLSHEYSDPTADYYEQKETLLKKGDLAGLMNLDSRPEGEFVEYPMSYQEYYSLAAPVLQLSYKKATEVYRKSDVKTAVSYMQYGFGQYGDPYGLWDWENGQITMADLKGEPDMMDAEGRLSPNTVILLLNDYGFFLSEAKRFKEAKPVLLNVIKLSPSRVVAYLNAADTEWALGEKKAAKAHYKQYLKLLGKNASKSPKRVNQRINSK